MSGQVAFEEEMPKVKLKLKMTTVLILPSNSDLTKLPTFSGPCVSPKLAFTIFAECPCPISMSMSMSMFILNGKNVFVYA